MNDVPTIGFLDNRVPGRLPVRAYITHRLVPMATVLRDFGTRLFIFSPRDVDAAAGTAEGLFVERDGYEPATVPVPSVVGDWHLGTTRGREDGRGLSMRDFRKWAKGAGVRVYSDGRLTRLLNHKTKAYAMLDEIAPGLHPPTAAWDGSAAAIEAVLADAGVVYLKPHRGSQGERIVVLERDGRAVVAKAYRGGERLRTRHRGVAEALEAVSDTMRDATYVLQPGVDLVPCLGRAPGLRVITVNDGERWHFFGKAVLAAPESDIANTSQGGTNHSLEWFYERVEGVEAVAAEIARLRDFTIDVSRKIERRYRRRVMELAFDILIDRDRKLHIVELNTKPGMTKPGLPDAGFANLFAPTDEEAPVYGRLLGPHATWLARFLQTRLHEHAERRIAA